MTNWVDRIRCARPDEAAAFVEATGVDALAVAVGTSHAMTERTTALDLDLIMELRASVDVPLVLHGSSGVPDHELVRAVRAGMTKINIATHLNVVFTETVRAVLADDPGLVDSRKYLAPARAAVAADSPAAPPPTTTTSGCPASPGPWPWSSVTDPGRRPRRTGIQSAVMGRSSHPRGS